MPNDNNRRNPKYRFPEGFDAPQPDHFPHINDEERDQIVAKLRTRKHKYQQSGNTITCISEDCNGTHGFQVPTHKQLVDTDERGLPVFRDVIL